MCSTLDDLILAGEADGQPGLAGIGLAHKFGDGVLELRNAVVTLPGIEADNFQLHTAMALDDLRGGFDTLLQSTVPDGGLRLLLLAHDDLDGDRPRRFVGFWSASYRRALDHRIGRGHTPDADASQRDFVGGQGSKIIGGIGPDFVAGATARPAANSAAATDSRGDQLRRTATLQRHDGQIPAGQPIGRDLSLRSLGTRRGYRK